MTCTPPIITIIIKKFDLYLNSAVQALVISSKVQTLQLLLFGTCFPLINFSKIISSFK